MLLVAMPKTASTSLIYTLRDCTGFAIQPHVENIGFAGDPVKYSELSKYHKSVYLKNITWLHAMAKDKRVIYRDHVLPEAEGAQFFKDVSCPVCVLYRNPEHIMDNYIRTALIENGSKLLEELKNLHNFYVSLAVSDNILLVSYREIVKKPRQTVKKIIAHFGIKQTKKIILQKKKYTGKGVERL